MAPEVINKKYNEKSDIWSIGCILYQIFTGLPPYLGVNEKQIIEDQSKPIDFESSTK